LFQLFGSLRPKRCPTSDSVSLEEQQRMKKRKEMHNVIIGSQFAELEQTNIIIL